MINKLANISIIEKDLNNYNINLKGSNDHILKGLALAVAETISALPVDYQQENRVIFLQYLNRATKKQEE